MELRWTYNSVGRVLR